MNAFSQALFERYTAHRLCLDPPDDRGTQRETLRNLRAYLMTLVEQTCLDQVSARLVSRTRTHVAQESSTTALPMLPETPVWLMLEEPLPLAVEDGDEQDVAAFFFRAPWSPLILSQIPAKGMPLLPPPTATQVARGYEWRLDLIDLLGESLAEYYLDQRTGCWRMLETQECPWRLCDRRIDPEVGYEVIVACEACQRTMERLTHLFCILLQPAYGRPLTLTNIAWQQSLRAGMASPAEGEACGNPTHMA